MYFILLRLQKQKCVRQKGDAWEGKGHINVKKTFGIRDSILGFIKGAQSLQTEYWELSG